MDPADPVGDAHIQFNRLDDSPADGEHGMNRRQFVTAFGGTAALATGYVSARIGDIRPYSPERPTGETPRERIIAAATHRFAVDHRALTSIEIRRDWTDQAPYELGRHQQWHEHSRRRHLHALTTFDAPLLASVTPERAPGLEYLSPHGTLPALLHYNRAFGADSLPLTYVMYVTDGTILYDFDAPTPSGGTAAGDIQVTDQTGRSGVGVNHDSSDPLLQEYIRPHRATWERVRENEATVTFRITAPDAYAQVVPLALTAVTGFVGPFIEVTLDRDTGRLRKVVDHRDVFVDVWPDEARGSPQTHASQDTNSAEKRLTYRIETVFDQYGTASAPRPSGEFDVALETKVKGFLSDLLRY
ncbi:hypothetical protein [Haloplanus pelagicus]|uniref:hypothetical protein n=1 Tax=Haloplanus pelagicus TaxID=2949995 RepID=UPI002040F196|nr:hypothetical protein [Haloplanus sp. HW8-1]